MVGLLNFGATRADRALGGFATWPLLIGGFLIMLILMFVLAIGAIRENDSLANLTRDIYRHPTTVINAVRDINTNIIDMHRYMLGVALARNSSELETSIAKVSKHEALVLKTFKIISKRFLGDNSLVVKARKSFAEWQPVRAKVIELARKGRQSEAAEITMEKSARHVIEITSNMNQLTSLANTKATQFLASSEKEQKRSRAFLYDMFLILMLIGSAIATFVVVRVNRIEESLKNATRAAEQANNAKSEFLSSMSHDLRTPLNAIVGFSDIMAQEIFGPLGNQKYLEYTNNIHSSGLHLVNIVNDILDLSKIEEGHYKLENTRVNLSEAVSSVLRMFSPQIQNKKLSTNVNIPDRLPDLWCDRRAVSQILSNLLSNAVKFNKETGLVSVQAHLNESGSVSLAVSDTGIGMSEDELNDIIEPFYSGNSHRARLKKGTGLGLHLCKKLTSLHDADLNIKSGENGTTVTLEFPKERVMEFCSAEKAA